MRIFLGIFLRTPRRRRNLALAHVIRQCDRLAWSFRQAWHFARRVPAQHLIGRKVADEMRERGTVAKEQNRVMIAQTIEEFFFQAWFPLFHCLIEDGREVPCHGLRKRSSAEAR